MSKTVTAEQRAANYALWRGRGEAWDRNAPETTSTSDALNQAMIEAAGIVAGDTVIDTAAGAGEPSISIARAIGGTGALFATDLAAEMLAGTRRRGAALGLGQIRFAAADMETLPFPDRCFDALTCRFGLMHVPGRDAAAAEARRVLKPGARAVYLVWGPAEDNTVYFVTEPIVREHFADRGAPGKRHSLGTPGMVTAILEQAGFDDIRETGIGAAQRVPAGERFWLARLERNNAGRLAAMCEAARAAMDEAMLEAFEPYRDGDSYLLRSHARLATGTVPATTGR